MLGKIGGSRKGGRQNLRWADFTTTAMDLSLQERSRAVEGRMWVSVIHGVIKSQIDSVAHHTHDTASWKKG